MSSKNICLMDSSNPIWGTYNLTMLIISSPKASLYKNNYIPNLPNLNNYLFKTFIYDYSYTISIFIFAHMQ